jgi:tetratricopeptide (TPR) repeat protein
VIVGILARVDHRGMTLPRRLGTPVLGCFACVALCALIPGKNTLTEAERALQAVIEERGSRSQIFQTGRQLIARHPADYALYTMTASAFITGPRPEPGQALAFINRGLYLKPRDWQSHMVAARALLDLGNREQGLLEFRLAFDAAPADSHAILLEESAYFAHGVSELRRIVPDDGAALAELLSQLLRSGRAADALALDRAAIEDQGEKAPAVLWVWQARLLHDAKDVQGTLDALDRADTLDAGRSDAAELRADVLIETERPAEAVNLLRGLVDRRPADINLALSLAEDYIRIGRPEAARVLLDQASPFARTQVARARLLSARGRALERQASTKNALEAFQMASRLDPDSVEMHLQLARSLEGAHRYREASTEVQRAMELAPEMASSQAMWRDWRARLDVEQRAEESSSK